MMMNGLNSPYGMMGSNNMNSTSAQESPFATSPAMSQMAMNNATGNPVGNNGANMMPYAKMAQNFARSPLNSMMNPMSMNTSNNYATGGYVAMADGGMPDEAMMAQMGGGMPQDGSSPLSGAMSGAEEQIDPAMVEQVQMTVQFIQEYIDAQNMGLTLAHINDEEYQALIQAFGEPEMITENLAKFAEGGEVDLEEATEAVASASEDDPHLVALEEDKIQFLIENFGKPTVNELTGLPQFGFFKSVAKAVKSVVKSPIFQAVAPIALNAFAPGIGSAIGSALGLGSMGTSALMGGGLGLLGGGGLKGAIRGAGMGALGQAGADYLSGSNPFAGLGGGTSGGEGGGLLDSLKTGAKNLFTSSPESQFTNVNGLNVLKSEAPSGGGGLGTGLLNIAKNNPITTALVGTTLLGGMGGKKQQDVGAPPKTPEDFQRKLPDWKLTREVNDTFNPLSYTRQASQGERNYFNDKWSQEPPVIARRGGYMNYADGGMSSPLAMVGGVPSLDEYKKAFGVSGGFLKGGDGVSDDIHATIGERQPAKLSGGEFVIPARVVSELGNGNSEAGAEKLYSLVNKVESKRKNVENGDDSRAYRLLAGL